MRKYNFKKDKWTVNVEEFENFNELLKVCDSRQENSWSNHSRKTKDSGWAGASYEEARDMLLYGWDEKIDDIRKEYDKYVKATETQRPKMRTAPVGFAPHVPNAIKGLPNSMFNTKLEPKKSKIIDVCVDFGVPARIEPEEVIEKMVKMLGKINNLELNGYRVKLSFLRTFNDEYNKLSKLSYVCKMVVKNEFQPMDLKRVSFPIGHPAMFRRLMFDWYERFPNAQEIYCYGHSMGVLSEENRKNLINLLCKENQYIIHFESDLDKVFANLK